MTLFLRDSALGSAPGMITVIMSEAAKVKCGSPGAVTVSRRLAKAIPELRRLQKLLLSGENLDPRILTDFRDALNHVRNTAWSAHHYIVSQNTEQDSSSVLSVVAGERVRVAYQLCQAIQADLKSNDIKFQAGQLIQLSLAAKALIEQLGEVVGEL
jgi:hypothetical protein